MLSRQPKYQARKRNLRLSNALAAVLPRILVQHAVLVGAVSMKAAAGFRVAAFMQAVSKRALLRIVGRLGLALGAATIVTHVEVTPSATLQSVSK